MVTIAYGVRNFEDRVRGLRRAPPRPEAPAAPLLILEFSKPSRLVRALPLHPRALRLPVLAGILTGDFGAYRYLGTSIAGFPDAAGLTRN